MSTSQNLNLTGQDISTTTNKSWTFFWEDYYLALGIPFQPGFPVVDGLITPITYSFIGPANLGYYANAADLKAIFAKQFHGNDVAPSDVQSVSAATVTAFESAALRWMGVANILLMEDSSSIGDITVGALDFGKFYQPANPATPASDVPAATVLTSSSSSQRAGDMWFNSGAGGVMSTAKLAVGKIGYLSVLHELGHALGLVGDKRSPFYGSQWDSLRYSVMSYKDLNGQDLSVSTTVLPSAPMLFDIARMQALYGANAATATGDDSYKFEVKDSWPIQAIWDAGGNDTINGGDQSHDLRIDLRAGGESYWMDSHGNRINGKPEIHIAFQPLLPDGTRDPRFANNFIENAVGGSGDDLIVGNDASNNLNGGDGADTVEGGAGNDVIVGGEDAGTRTIDRLSGGVGNDIYIYSEGDGQDEITDIDGDNVLVVGGSTLNGQGAQLKVDVNAPSLLSWTQKLGGKDLLFTLGSGFKIANGQLTGTGRLVISGAALGTAGSITINDFANGKFGITLDPNANAIVEIGGPSTLTEGLSGLVKIKLAGIAQEGDILHVQATGLSGLKGVFGAQTENISQGGYDVVLAQGQTEVIFSLLADAPADADAEIELTAKLLSSVGQQQGDSQTFAVHFDAAEELGTTRTIVGDIKIKDFEPDEEGVQPHLDSLGNRITSGEVDLIQDDLNGSAGADTIIGGAGGDILKGKGGDDVIFAEASVDVNAAIAAGAIGLGNPDLLVMSGAAGNDFLSGNGGNDTLVGTGGAEVLAGGAGNDLIVAGQGDDFLDGDAEMSVSTFDWTFNWTFTETNNNGYLYNLTGDGTSFVVNPSGSGDDTLYAGGGNDVVGAGFGNDLVFGEDGDDKIWGDGGRDTLLGGDGDDKIYGDVGWVTTDNPANDAADFIDGGAGNDELRGDGGSDVIFGGVGDDTLVGDRDDQHSGDDYLDGEDGDDTLLGSGGADRLIGGNGNDKLYGDSADTGEEFRGDDYLDGGAGDDLLLGDGGADVLIGGTGNDLLYGEASDTPESVIGADYLDGGEGNDIVVGAGGSDTLYGGDGDDQLVGDGNNTPSGYEGDDYLDGGAGNDLLFGDGGADTLIGGDGDDQLAGESGDTTAEAHGDDYLDGGAGNDLLIGAGGADTLIGGAGNDSLYGEAGDTPLEVQGDDLLDGGDGDDTLVGAGGADILFGGSGNDTLFGDSSATAAELQLGDYLDGGDGDDVISGSGGDDTLVGGGGNDRLFGGAGADTLYGGDGNDTLYFGEGGDTLSGGAGDDNYYFQIPAAWFDYGYFTDIPEVHIQDWDQDTASGNSLTFGFSFAGSGLYLGVGSLTLNFAQYPGLVVHIDGFDQFDPYGSEVISRFIFGDRILSYEDILALGFDFQGTPDVDTLVGTGADDRIQALASDDILYGAGGNDLLDGGTGADEMQGGEGNDTYLVDDVGDSVIELEAEGTDLVESSITYTLTDNVENLTLTGTEALNGTGNQLSNVINGNDSDNTLLGLGGNDTLVGNGGNDRLDGGEGADIMTGGAGDDVYIADIASDSITENAGEGLDRVESSASYTLGTNIENLLLTGTNAINGSGNDLANEIAGNDANNVLNGAGGDDTLIGNGGADTLNGGAGNDTLSGGAGNDTLSGGAGTNTLTGGSGDDVYLADGAGTNTIVELANEGTDRVDASVTHTLVDNVENLTLTGGTAIAGTGNALDNVIRGNSSHNSLYGLAGIDQLFGGAGDDVLDGGEGADRLEGGTGNDTYIVDNAADQVIETTSNDFNDRLQASVSYTLANSARIEHFVLTGGDAINATGNASVWDYLGNEADNIITDFGSASLYGNGGSDTLIATGDYSNDLDGGAGIDTMQGGNGSDTYVVDNTADVVVENLDEGYDEVESSATYTLSANVERLRLIGGAGDIDGAGNEIANEIEGNEGNNALLGLQGEDWLYGGEGDDTLDGGADNDYLYGEFGNDVIAGGAGADYLYDTEGENVLSGGAGDDLYYVGDNSGQDSSHSVVIEQANEGYDIVHSTVSFTLGDNVETLYIDDPFFGFNPFTFRAGTGNDLANTIYGSNARNTLTGLGGNDSIDGRAGNDEIYGNEGDDVLYGGDDNSFAGGEGSADGYLENDDLIDGGAGNDNIDGGSGDDTLLGDEGDDSLFGGQDDIGFGGGFGGGEGYGYGYGYGYPLTNNDYLDGGAGDDILDGGSGNDALFGGDGVDHLYGGSDGSINYENDDVLDGGAGLDTMEGGSGNDTYYVDGTYIEVPDPDALDGCGDPIPGATKRSWTTDTIIEGAEAGYDVVYSTASIVLPENFEEVHLVGEDNIDATGSSGDEYLEGNSGNNRLDGGAGEDYMAGGLGDDTLVVRDAGDAVEELEGEGVDTIEAAIDFTLTANFENLTLIGSAVVGTGSEIANLLRGNAGDNQLFGLGGNDELNGGAGNDELHGGDGDDVYRFGAGSGNDTVHDIVGLNTVRLLGNLTAADLTLAQSGNDLVLTIDATGEQLTLVGWNSVTALNSGNLRLCVCGCPVVFNTAPTALGDSANLVEDVTLVAGGNLLTNDSDPDAGTTLSVVDARTVTGMLGSLVIATDGTYAFTLNNALVQSLAAGQTLSEAYGYTITDNHASAPLTASANLTIVVTGTNDAPVANDDTGSVAEDGALSAAGNVLANDTDIDQGTTLAVSNAGSQNGTYGTLTLGASGAWSYLLDNASAAVQSLGQGETELETFAYTATDGAAPPLTDSANLVISVAGTNDAPILVTPLGDQNTDEGEAFSYTVPSNSFTDIDRNDALSYAATLADGSALPTWLSFNTSTRQFTGTPPAGAAGSYDVRVVATDLFGAIASDVFALTVAVADPTSDTLYFTKDGCWPSGSVSAGGACLEGLEQTHGVYDGGAGTDTLVGTECADAILLEDETSPRPEGTSGPRLVSIEVIDAGGGNDVVDLSSTLYTYGPVTVHGGEGDDTLIGGAGPNVLNGGAGCDSLIGGAANDVLNGGQSCDTMAGGIGNDDYHLDDEGDVVIEESDSGTDTVISSVSVCLAANVENLVLVGTAVAGHGNELDNVITGNSTNNELSGGEGTDTLLGGAGNDVYYIGESDSADLVVELAAEGADEVRSLRSYVLTDNVENLTLLGGDCPADINATGNSGANVLTGNAGNNVLDGAGGADTLVGGAGNDTYILEGSDDVIAELGGEGHDTVRSALSHALGANVEDLELLGSGNASATGNALDNELTGNSGDNVVEGGAGNDLLRGGAGADTYHFSAGFGHDTVRDTLAVDPVTGTPDEDVSVDVIRFDATITPADIALRVGSADPRDLQIEVLSTGDRISLQNFLADDDASDRIEEIRFSDGTTWTSANVLAQFSRGFGTEGNDELSATPTGSLLYGRGGHDHLYGSAASDVLDGGAGDDEMAGGAGDDAYIVDDWYDEVTENAAEGVDTVYATVSVALTANVENAVLWGSNWANATGNELANVLTGNSAGNLLDGGAGADTMRGGAGDDEFVVDSAGDVVIENEGEGWDRVYSDISYVLGENVEGLELEGSAHLTGTGNTADNKLIGNSGNNLLDGGAGADYMAGGAGDDTYVVESDSDQVVESSNIGNDTVLSSVTYALGARVENLILLGTEHLDGTGNSLANVLTGNAGNNVLNGGGGADQMIGGAGDDTYIVNVTEDQVVEVAGGGVDTVRSSVSYTLGTGLEHLTLTGSGAVNAYGNDLDNILTGNGGVNRLEGHAGNDTLTGGGGADTMIGGGGDDTYFVNAVDDVVTENAGEGFDIVNTSVGGMMAANIEALFLTGSTGASVSGNALDNLIRGNSAGNVLNGGAGIDVLEGGGGADTLTDTMGAALFNGGSGTDTMTGSAANDFFLGGLGNDVLNTGGGADVIVFNRGDGKDTVNASTGLDDTLSLGAGILYADLLFKKSGNNLILVTHSNEQLTFVDWYAAPANRSVDTLQVIIEGTSDYDGSSADALRNRGIQAFDFAGLVAAFDVARAANPSLTSWSLTNALANFHASGSDTAAIGGDLAYRYGRDGTLADISFNPALGIIGGGGFGGSAQVLQSIGSLQDGSPRLGA